MICFFRGVVNDFWDYANPPGSVAVDSTELGDFIKRYNENSTPGKNPINLIQ